MVIMSTPVNAWCTLKKIILNQGVCAPGRIAVSSVPQKNLKIWVANKSEIKSLAALQFLTPEFYE